MENLTTLIVGGGYVGTEKLNAVLKNSPAAKITMVSISFSDAILELAKHNANVTLIKKKYDKADIEGADIVIAAINDDTISPQIVADANKAGVLVNAADKPDLCDFYLSSVVIKGNLKIAISTNGTSPTIAKRLKEVLNDCLPEEIDDLLLNILQIRKSLSGDFTDKVKQLNFLTKSLIEKKEK